VEVTVTPLTSIRATNPENVSGMILRCKNIMTAASEAERHQSNVLPATDRNFTTHKHTI
jgi:hypothetical protein